MKKTLLCIFSFFTFLGYAQTPVEGFEGSWPPEGWSVYQNEIGTAIMWEQSQLADPFVTPYEGNFATVLHPNVNPGGITMDWLVSPAFTVQADQALRFFSRLFSPGNQGAIYKVMIIPADADASQLTNYSVVQQWTESQLNPMQYEYTENIVTLPEMPGPVRIAFLMESQNGEGWIIDNVNIVNNACPMPTNLGVSDITVSGATLQWQGTAEAWEIEVLPAADAPTGVGVEIEENSYMVTSLAPGIYKYYVRAKCNEDEYSYWQGPRYFIINNSIAGVVRYDYDNDGDCDNDDTGVPGVVVNITIGENVYTVYTNAYGQYALNNIALTDNVTVEVVAPAGFPEVEPISLAVNPDGDPTLSIDACLGNAAPIDNLVAAIVPINAARPGVLAQYKIVVTNMGNTVIPTASVTLTFDDTRLDFSNATGTPAVNGENITFTLTNLQPFSINVRNVNFMVAQPPVNIGGEILDFTAVVTPDEDDVSPEDNTTELNQTIVNSYDPNDITCHQGASIYEDETEDYLYYTIRFQNTGNGEAINIRLENLLEDNLDWDTFQPLSSSHDYTVQREGNEVQFYYTDINLPHEAMDEPGSHGYVTYRIKPTIDVSLGDFMYNEAGIYFDFNPVIETNTAETEVIERPVNGVADNAIQNIAVYPNPVKDVLTVQIANETVSLIEVYDVNGRLCLSQDDSTTVNMQSLNAGLYFVKVIAGNSVTTKKIVKQ